MIQRMRKTLRDWCSASPDHLPILGDIGSCCERHDKDYAAGGTEEDRRKADWRLRQCIHNRYKGHCVVKRIAANAMANAYLIGVRLFGWAHFHYRKESELSAGTLKAIRQLRGGKS